MITGASPSHFPGLPRRRGGRRRRPGDVLQRGPHSRDAPPKPPATQGAFLQRYGSRRQRCGSCQQRYGDLLQRYLISRQRCRISRQRYVSLRQRCGVCRQRSYSLRQRYGRLRSVACDFRSVAGKLRSVAGDFRGTRLRCFPALTSLRAWRGESGGRASRLRNTRGGCGGTHPGFLGISCLFRGMSRGFLCPPHVCGGRRGAGRKPSAVHPGTRLRCFAALRCTFALQSCVATRTPGVLTR